MLLFSGHAPPNPLKTGSQRGPSRRWVPGKALLANCWRERCSFWTTLVCSAECSLCLYQTVLYHVIFSARESRSSIFFPRRYLWRSFIFYCGPGFLEQSWREKWPDAHVRTPSRLAHMRVLFGYLLVSAPISRQQDWCLASYT